MNCSEVIKYLEGWAPKGIAWERDNIGLQVGNSKRTIKNIMLSLELDKKVLEQAINKNCNLIITHHPLLFTPLRKLDFEKSSTAILIEALIKNNISLYSAHTNLDFTKDGVSFSLAKQLKLQNVKFLKNITEKSAKLVVFVPESNVEQVASALHKAGAGIIGNYTNCSFRLDGKGTFKGSEETNPFKGKKEQLESVAEIRLEMIVDSWKINEVIEALIASHPYEEVAYDIYPLLNENVNYGIGAIGDLKESMKTNEFLSFVSKSLRTKSFRYTKGKSQNIKKVAVCGGSCSDLLETAITQDVDAFITADVKYHAFQAAKDKVLFIDAGHYETEIHSLNEVQRRLNNLISKRNNIKVFKYSGSTNPVIFYNN